MKQQQEQNSRHISINESSSVSIKTDNKIYKISRILSIQPTYICLQSFLRHQWSRRKNHCYHIFNIHSSLPNKLDLLVQREKEVFWFWILGVGLLFWVFCLLWFFIKKYITRKLAFAQGNNKLHICQIKS